MITTFLFALLKWLALVYVLYYVGFCLRAWWAGSFGRGIYEWRFQHGDFRHCQVYRMTVVIPGLLPRTKDVFFCNGVVVSFKDVEKDRMLYEEEERNKRHDQSRVVGEAERGSVVYPDVAQWKR